MSNRFHNKWHRHNHSTYPVDLEADSGHDPIASPLDPFKGDFILNGSLSACAPASAYAGIFKSDNTAICAIGGTIGIYASGVSQDTGNIMIDTWSDDVIFPDVTKPAIFADGSIVATKAISADSLWTNQLYSVSSITRVHNVDITELSGFKIVGSDFAQDIPATINISTDQGLYLMGIGITGTSWGAFGGDLQTHRNLRVDNNSYISGSEVIGNDLYISGAGFVEDGLNVTNGNIIVPYGDITEQNGNSNEWNSVYTSVNNTSGNWNSVYTSVNNTSGNWNSVYTSVNNTSGSWNSVYTSVNNTSGNWNSVYTSVNNTSGNWNSVYTSVNNTSGTWNGNFCNNVVSFNQISACNGTISLSGDLTFASNSSAVTFTNRISSTLTSPTSAGWLIVNVNGVDRAILLYNFDII
jgi:hypothetical protein